MASAHCLAPSSVPGPIRRSQLYVARARSRSPSRSYGADCRDAVSVVHTRAGGVFFVISLSHWEYGASLHTHIKTHKPIRRHMQRVYIGRWEKWRNAIYIYSKWAQLEQCACQPLRHICPPTTCFELFFLLCLLRVSISCTLMGTISLRVCVCARKGGQRATSYNVVMHSTNYIIAQYINGGWV